jgi:uncharacterized membrane protein YcaP (DUF421 family)
MFSNPYLNILVSCSVIYVFITLAIRVFGKKELAQLSVLDLVFILLISNAVQNAMVGSDSSLLGGIIAALTLFALNFVFKFLIFRYRTLKHLMEGEPILLISKGKVISKNLRQLRITDEELMESVREHGVKSITQVDLAMLEVDGNISILSDNYQKQSFKMVNIHKKRKRVSTVNTIS